ncbi:MAG: preprotein translocase subunit SecE [Oscillospiraceae bacterium]|jgi:preprotein translocase subunit SecE|nr:preprotein translocase subunit SecE [Oscillospiraceae bacterium]MBR0450931.1 preprotein translocase subunit SecE [Oscillospiraceae bacterium]
MADKTKKPGFFARFAKYFKDAKGEFKKIVWPSKKQVWNNVVVILAMVLVFAILTWGIDYIFAFLRDLLLKQF